jgi:hypothetical protein
MVSNLPKKTTKKNEKNQPDSTMITQAKLFFFRFLEEFKTQKGHFEMGTL